MTAYDPLTVGCGLYVPDERHVARARWWLAAHPRTRDRAAIAAGVRRELTGLRAQDVAALMDEVLDGVGTWADPAGWPAEWPEPWGRGEAHVHAPEPEAVPPTADPEAVAPPIVVMPATPRAPALPRRRAPPRTPRPSRSTGGAGRTLPGADEAVPEPIAGVPRWEGHPVRASRIPRHLLPMEARHLAPGARWLLWRAATEKRCLRLEAIMEEAKVTRKGVQEWLTALRAAGLMRTAHDTPARVARKPDPTPYASARGPRPVDYSRLLTDKGRAVVAQLPAVVEVVTGRATADDVDMSVLSALLRHARERAAVGTPDDGMRLSALREVPGCDHAPRACARLERSGAIVKDWENRGWRVWLAPEVARAWGVPC